MLRGGPADEPVSTRVFSPTPGNHRPRLPLFFASRP